MINILIADDHELIRNGIKSVLEDKGDIHVLGEASNGKEAYQKIVSLNPDVVLLDISMPEMSGIELKEVLNKDKNETKILFLTMYEDYEYINKCLETGASGYLVKGDSGIEIEDAVRTVANGGAFFSGSVQEIVMKNYANQMGSRTKESDKEQYRLTKREKEVVKLVAKGLTSTSIAAQLFVSPRTIDTHRANLMKKMEVKNSVELINKARALNLL